QGQVALERPRLEVAADAVRDETGRGFPCRLLPPAVADGCLPRLVRRPMREHARRAWSAAGHFTNRGLFAVAIVSSTRIRLDVLKPAWVRLGCGQTEGRRPGTPRYHRGA